MRSFLLEPNSAYFISTRFNSIFVIAVSSLCLLTCNFSQLNHTQGRACFEPKVGVSETTGEQIPYLENSAEKLEHDVSVVQ